MVLESLSESTWKQYQVHLKQWWIFCSQNSKEPSLPTVQNVLHFLNFLKDSGKSYSTINSSRSAVSILDPYKKIGEDPLVVRFMKGIFRTRPPKAKYNSTWDPSCVLGYLHSLGLPESLSLESLTYKTVGLLAICTAHRAQTFSKIMRQDIRIYNDYIEIFISALIKTSRPNSDQPTLVLPFYTDKSTCAATAILEYAKRTKAQSDSVVGTGPLFLSLNKLATPVSAQTISRWIKQVLRNSGVDVNQFTAHSVRHASTSLALKKGVSIDIIRDRAGWSQRSAVFARFYNRPIDERFTFVDSIIN